jgi:hypothetical protein
MSLTRRLPKPDKAHGVLYTSEVDSGADARNLKVGQRDPSLKQHRQQRHLLIVQARGRPGKVNTINFTRHGLI